MTPPDKNLPDYNANRSDFEPVRLTVPADFAGLRLDQALVRFFPEYSRSRLQDWIAQQQVTLDGSLAKANGKVWGGEVLEVLPQLHPSEQPYCGEDIGLDIVHQDEAILVINKPVGLVVHPGSGNWQGTLLNALLHHFPQLAGVPRAGIVHRLDKDTSGLMVVAKTIAAQTNLVWQLEARSVKREYMALVYGELKQGGVIDAPIGRHPVQRTKMAVVQNGKPAVTHYRVEESLSGCTLLCCRLETGRTHQIRVHLSHLKYPLVGDGTYLKGQAKCPPNLRAWLHGFPRQALHATRLGLQHPGSGELLEWQVPMPADMQRLLTQIREAG
ncbi:MAG: 23S rRNA pseudouridine(1911/1915/1917) synthase RluD [Pseudomonadota bacterium]